MRPDGRVRRGRPKKSSSSGSSAAHVIACNDDMLLELLLRLPVKSLLKLRSVSKHWLGLIRDPYFIRRKNLKSGSGAASALFMDCTSEDSQRCYEVVPVDPSQEKATFKYLSFEDSQDGIEILQSCKGLLLCCSGAGKDKYLVYNPSTKQFKTLPPLDSGKPVLCVSLAFDPSKSNSYKVVCIESCKSSYNCIFQILIYSSDSGHWRVARGPISARPFILYWYGAYCNGAIHWVTWRTDTSIYFDVNEEVVGETPMPPSPDEAKMRLIPYFGESGGHLHFVDNYQDLTSVVHVYEMERDRSSWFVKFQVDRDKFPLFKPRHCDIFPSFRILCLVRGDKEEDSFLVIHSNGIIIIYNCFRQTHQEVRCADSPHSRVFQYIECFLPLYED